MKRKTVWSLVTLSGVCFAFMTGCGSPVKTSSEPKKPTTTSTLSVSPEDKARYLHVPSPDWRDQIIYFIMIDRFNDGNPANNDMKAGEYDPKENAKFSGGDLAGIAAKLDYIQGLGATAIWITPPVANQWWDPLIHYGGYHGYWARDFMAVDEHFGTLEDYQALSVMLHKRGMYLVQDIVCNHVGNFFTYTNTYNPSNVTQNLVLNTKSLPTDKPTRYPFDQNDPRDPKQRELGIYHWTPPINNYQDPYQKLYYQLSDLDDLNTTNEIVIKALKDAYNFWITNVGVDGFRIDTIMYVDHAFWHRFIHDKEEASPGVAQMAKKYNKTNFFAFGEAWFNSTPYHDDCEKQASSYLGTPEKPELHSVLNFALQQEIKRVFAEGGETSLMTYRFSALKKNFRNIHYLLNFIDNHDMNRFLQGATVPALKQALVFLFTIPGIPVIYYGTEQKLTETRASLFPTGYGSGGKERFATDGEMYRFLQDMAQLRKTNQVFRRGDIIPIKDDPTGPGVFAYLMKDEKDTAVVIFNTSEEDTLVDNLSLGTQGPALLEVLYATRKVQKPLLTDISGKISFVLKGRSTLVAMVRPTQTGFSVPASISLEIPKAKILSTNLLLRGKMTGVSNVLLVIDGKINTGIPVTANEKGEWATLLPVESLDNGTHRCTLYGITPGGDVVVSPTYPFEVKIEYKKVLSLTDPVGDDKGPFGNYRYPTDVSFDHQMDIERVEILRARNNLMITLTMAKPISTVWNPKNGFDHVTFYIYFSLAGKEGGATVLPRQQAKTPAGFAWHYMSMVGGWNNSLYSSRGASEKEYGTPVSASPKIIVNTEKRQITLRYPAAAFENPKDISGMKIYITTWDYDGMESANRPIEPEPKAYRMGGDPNGPMIMDDVGPFTLP
ncbi:MAG: alpha-amylase family glycosyl hydrolase [Brevinematales bacterium]|nr:alpha-amylase family glycosyl hydrolase [Brevinematales bacterium]